MKLIIQIPCKDEEKTLPTVIKNLPKHINGISLIEYQIIDDGSTDNTINVAKDLGVQHIISFTQNKGLGFAFKEGLNNALQLGADIIVNTDGDNQYPGHYIQDLIKPILSGQADIVIGNRNPSQTKHFSTTKRFLQRLGNKLVSFVTGMPMKDSVSGFRAYNRDAMIQLNITSRFSYVLDTLVQAIKKGLKIQRIDIHTNPPTRPSRLFPSLFQYIKKTTVDLIRVYIMYEPFKFLMKASAPFLILGLFGIIRFLYFYLHGFGQGKIQSLVISGICIQIGLTFVVVAILADLIAKNRFLIEENLKISKLGKQ